MITKKPLPPRLEKLNRELKTERTKDFDYIYIVGDGWRIKVCVMRDEDGRFFAAAKLGKKTYRERGPSPSGALDMLIVAIKRDKNWKYRAEKEAALMARGVE